MVFTSTIYTRKNRWKYVCKHCGHFWIGPMVPITGYAVFHFECTECNKSFDIDTSKDVGKYLIWIGEEKDNV